MVVGYALEEGLGLQIILIWFYNHIVKVMGRERNPIINDEMLWGNWHTQIMNAYF